MACHDIGLDAIRKAVEGKDTPLSEAYRKCMSDISKPPPGSQNWPIQLRVAAVINGHLDASIMLPFLRGENRWGHNGMESGSGIYEAWNVATVIALLHWARRRENAEIIEACRGWLRAEWVKLALAATRMPKKISVRAVDRNGNESTDVRSPGVGNYRGLMVHLAGNRMYTDLGRNAPHEYPVERSYLGPLLSWAVDWEPRGAPHIDRAHHGGGWTIWLIEKISGRSYNRTVPPGFFGLTESLRQSLHAYIGKPTRVDVKPLLSHLDPYRMRGNVSMIYLALAGAGVATVLSRIENGNKPGIPIVTATRERSSWAGPSRYAGVGVAQAVGRIEGDELVGEQVAQQMSTRLRLPAAERYRIIHDKAGVRLDGEPVAGGAEPKDPVDDVAVDPPTSSPSHGAIGWAETIPALAEIPQPTSRKAKTAIRQIQNRAREIVRLVRLGDTAGAIKWAETIPALTEVPRPFSGASRTAIKKIQNRVREIIRLLRLP